MLKNQFTISDLHGFYMVSIFLMVNIGGEEKCIVPMNDGSLEMRYHVHYNEMYIIEKFHIATGNRGRILQFH